MGKKPAPGERCPCCRRRVPKPALRKTVREPNTLDGRSMTRHVYTRASAKSPWVFEREIW